MSAGMRNLLYLVHRLPYPPNKGDKVRSYHLLAHLAALRVAAVVLACRMPQRRAGRASTGPRDAWQVLAEVAASTITERGATRADDRLTEAAMEDRKKDGYF